jgi:tol-pal system protein YbgF
MARLPSGARASGFSAAFALACLVLLGGCSGAQSSEEKQLAELREEITHVQSQSDKFEERLDKLEVDSADLHTGDVHASASAPPARALSAPIATPQLRVVHMGPDPSATEETGAADEAAGAVDEAGKGGAGAKSPDDADRVKIQGSGEAVTVTDGKGARPKRMQEALSYGGKPDSFTNANLGASLATHSAGRTGPLDQDAKKAYDAALVLVNSKHYSEALDALAGFLVRWPDHPNADNAMYWRGQCYFAQGDYQNAAQELSGLLARFPAGNKAPDALLKLGMSEQRLGDDAAARQSFDRLRRDFPRTDAARRIPAGAQTVRPDAAPPASGDKP